MRVGASLWDNPGSATEICPGGVTELDLPNASRFDIGSRRTLRFSLNL